MFTELIHFTKAVTRNSFFHVNFATLQREVKRRSTQILISPSWYNFLNGEKELIFLHCYKNSEKRKNNAKLWLTESFDCKTFLIYQLAPIDLLKSSRFLKGLQDNNFSNRLINNKWGHTFAFIRVNILFFQNILNFG